jgi:nicotinamide mononucleotide transporter
LIVLFTAWGYGVTVIEFAALVLALPALGFGIIGSRWTWPPGFLASLLFCLLFVEFSLFASAALQVFFMVTAVWGWFAWGKEGALVPGRITLAGRIRGAVGVAVLSAMLASLLGGIGGAASWGDAYVLVGSLTAQLLLVLEKFETWPLWMTVNIVGALLYASQGLYFTALFNAVLFVLAAAAWRAWSGRTADHARQADLTLPLVGRRGPNHSEG